MNNKNLICYMSETSTRGVLDLTTINSENGWGIIPYSHEMSPKDVSAFFKHVPCFMTHFAKAIIFNVYDFQHPDFKSNIHFRRAMIEELEKSKIPYYFVDIGTFFITGLFIGAKIHCISGENVFVVRVGNELITVTHFIRERSGYHLESRKEIEFSLPISDSDKLKNDILGDDDENFKKVILAPFSPISESHVKSINNLLTREKLFSFETADIRKKYFEQILMEMANIANDKNRTRYKIFPTLYMEFFVDNNQKKCIKGINIIELKCDHRNRNDLKKTCVAPRTHQQYYVGYILGGKIHQLIEKYPLPEGQYHRIKLTLEVDSNILPKLIQEAYIDLKIEQLPNILTEKMDSKIPVIGFFDNSSVICIWNESEKCYKFSQKWNGMFGEDLFISFDEKKPKYRNQAVKVLKEKPTFVVYEVLRIMTSVYGMTHVNPNWQFTVTKDDDYPVLIKFDNLEGKPATPEFIMASLLKDHVKVIKKETGIKTGEIGFVFFDKNELDKWSHIEDFVKDACDLANIVPNFIEI